MTNRRNVFDRVDEDSDDLADGDAFTVQFSTETAVVEWREGMTVRDAFVSQADLLGFDFSRNLQYRNARGQRVEPDSEPEPNGLYIAAVQHESKG